MEQSAQVIFFNSWLWVIFVVAGLLMIIAELIIGVETGFNLVIVGSILALAGLVTSFTHSWVVTAVCAGVLCIIYFVVGRRFINLRRWQGEIKTGADALIGQNGIVTSAITRVADGSVKVRNESFRARAEEDIAKGEEIEVIGIKGTTLIVKKKEVT